MVRQLAIGYSKEPYCNDRIDFVLSVRVRNKVLVILPRLLLYFSRFGPLPGCYVVGNLLKCFWYISALMLQLARSLDDQPPGIEIGVKTGETGQSGIPKKRGETPSVLYILFCSVGSEGFRLYRGLYRLQ